MTPTSRSPTQTEQILRDTFSAKLDRDFIGGSGAAPVPRGILGVAAEVTGADWLAAAIKAKAEIATAGGVPSHIALSPAVIGDLEDTRDEIGHQLYPDASQVFAGLETVSAVAATQPVVYDSRPVWMAIRRDFVADFSDQVSEAWNRYATSLRIVARFALAAPLPPRRCESWRSPGPRQHRGQGQDLMTGQPGGPAAGPAACRRPAEARPDTARATADRPRPRLAPRAGALHGTVQAVTPDPPWEAWAPPLDPPAAGGLPYGQAEAIAAPAGTTTRTWPPS